MKQQSKKTPVLRFPEFSESWELHQLGDVTKISSGGTPDRTNQNYWNGAIPWVTTTLIDFKEITAAEEYITDSGLRNSSAKVFPAGTVLMAMYGQGKTRGKVGILSIEATTNQACAALLPDKDKINELFLFQNLAGRYSAIRKLSNSGGQENLSAQLIRTIGVAFPSLREQEKIATFLSAVDEKIVQLARKKELLVKYKEGVMQQLFDQKIRFKDDDDNDFPDWEDIPFGEIAKLGKEKFDASSRESRKCVELEHLEPGTGKLQGTIDSSSQKSVKNVFAKGDILFGKLRPYLRKFWHAEFDGVCSSEIWVIKPQRTFSSDILFYLIQTSSFFQAVSISSGSKMPRAEWAVVSKYTLSLPTDENEQLKIAGFLSVLDSKIELIGQQLERIRGFKNGLLQQMFV